MNDHQSSLSRKQLIWALARGLVTSVLLIAAYYLLPFKPHRGDSVLLELAGGLLVFFVVLGYEVRAVVKDYYPMKRAAISIFVLLPLYIVVFAWVYLLMSESNPDMFGQVLTRTDSLYFTVTVLSTVGFGDITAHTQTARGVVTFQMIVNIIVIAFLFRILFVIASKKKEEREEREKPAL